MKKLLFLPLAVLACVACTKTDDLTAYEDAAALQQNDAVQASVQVVFNNLVPSHLTNETTVTYTDAAGVRQTLRPTQLTSYIDAAPNSSVDVNILVAGESYDEIQALLFTNTGFHRELSSPNPLTGYFSFNTAEAPDNQLEITLQID